MFVSSWLKPSIRVLVLGLDASGKTTIQDQIRTDPAPWTYPGIGFNVDVWKYHNLEITSWDLGGQDKIRVIWKHYYPGVQGLVFVVDSTDSDQDRMSSARDELNLLLAEADLDDVPLLVLANKQDLPGCMTAAEISDTLELESLFPRPWRIRPVCATTKEGLHEAFDWLRTACSSRNVACAPALPPLRYLPGHYIAHTRLQVFNETPRTTPVVAQCVGFSGFVDRGADIDISEVKTFGSRQYGFLSEPVRGWVFMGAHGSGEHIRQHDYVVTLSRIFDEARSTSIKCTNLGGDEVAILEVDTCAESVAHFRAHLSAKLGKPNLCLKVVMPDGSLLPLGGSKGMLLEALMLKPSDMHAICKEGQTVCLVQ